MTLDEIENWFTHHPPVGDEPQRYEAIRNAGKILAKTIYAAAPPGPDRDLAIMKVREAVMVANAAIACRPGR